MKYTAKKMIPKEEFDNYGAASIVNIEKLINQSLADVIIRYLDQDMAIIFSNFITIWHDDIKSVSVERSVTIEPLSDYCSYCERRKKDEHYYYSR